MASFMATRQRWILYLLVLSCSGIVVVGSLSRDDPQVDSKIIVII